MKWLRSCWAWLCFWCTVTPEEKREMRIGNDDDFYPVPHPSTVDSELAAQRCAGFGAEPTCNAFKGDGQGDAEIDLTPTWRNGN